jgi:hypothetical protein
VTTSEKNQVQCEDEFIYSDFKLSEGATPATLEDLLNRWTSVKIIRKVK